ncbi:MAG: MATE family efflux transporter [Fusobacteriaceae bacterium]
MNNKLEKEKISKLMFQYCFPSVLSMWIFSTYGIVDGFFISNYLGESALASINIALPFINFAFAIGIMVSVGAGTIIGIRLGEKKYKESCYFYSLAIQLLIIFGIIISFMGMFFNQEIVLLLGATSKISQGSAIYLGTVSFFILTFILGYGLEVFVRIDGSPSYSIICLVIGAFTNIILDYVFIYKLNLGIRGAALATGIGQASTIIPLIYYLKVKRMKLYFNFVKFNLNAIKNIFFNGSPEFVTEITTAFLIVTFNMNIIKIIGEKGIASFGIISYFSTFVTMTMIGFAQGIQPIISYNLGAQKNHRILEILKKSFYSLIILGISFYLIINIFSNNIISLFISNNKELSTLTKSTITYYSFTYLFTGISILGTSFLTAVEESFKSNLLSIFKGIILINILLLTLPKLLGINGLWLSSSINEFIVAIISIYTIKIYVKKWEQPI